MPSNLMPKTALPEIAPRKKVPSKKARPKKVPSKKARPKKVPSKKARPKNALPKTAFQVRKMLALVAAATAAPLALAGCVASSPTPGTAAGPVQVSPAVDAGLQDLLDTGTRQYYAYVKDQTDQLVNGTKTFAASYAAGDAANARGLYAATRMHWERIEPVAESFGDLDPKLDAREADLGPGQEWTGWHRAEKDLFPPAAYTPLTAAEREAVAMQLVEDTEDLAQRTRSVELSTDKISNGAKELLDEVATGKVTGEEEIWSHTDLWDFQANVDGARVAFESLKPALERKDPTLADTLDVKFAALQEGLKKHSIGTGFAFYNDLSQSEIQQLAALVDALGEPLAKLTSAVVQ